MAPPAPPAYLASTIMVPDILPYNCSRINNSASATPTDSLHKYRCNNAKCSEVSVAEMMRLTRLQSASPPIVHSPRDAVTRRTFSAQVEDGRSIEESIYEEPPSQRHTTVDDNQLKADSNLSPYHPYQVYCNAVHL
jgi:hypothetical protein